MAEITLPASALVTVDEVRTAALGADRWVDKLDEDSKVYQACVNAIEDYSDRVTDYLDRRLLVHALPVQRVAWHWDVAERRYTCLAREWPVVEVLTPGAPALEVRDELLYTTYPADVVVAAGYRRRDQTLATLREDETLAELSVLPPPVPGDIRRCVIRLVVAEMRQQASGLVGVASRAQRIDNQVISSHRESADFEATELEKIYRHRRIA